VDAEVAAYLTGSERTSAEALERQAGRAVAVEPVPELGREDVEVRLGA